MTIYFLPMTRRLFFLSVFYLPVSAGAYFTIYHLFGTVIASYIVKKGSFVMGPNQARGGYSILTCCNYTNRWKNEHLVLGSIYFWRAFHWVFRVTCFGDYGRRFPKRILTNDRIAWNYRPFPSGLKGFSILFSYFFIHRSDR